MESFHGGDEAVIHTNDDASECKKSAVQRGYYQDNYIGCFVKSIEHRKAPEINRGYYARVKGIEMFIEKFLNVSIDRQESFFITFLLFFRGLEKNVKS